MHRLCATAVPCFLRELIPTTRPRTINRAFHEEGNTRTHLSCTLKSSSMSSSSQLSSHSLSPPDFAAPGAVPPRCAKSVCESSQSTPASNNSAFPPFHRRTRTRTRGTKGAQGHTSYCELLKLIVLLQDAEVRDIVVLGVFCRRGALDRLRCR